MLDINQALAKASSQLSLYEQEQCKKTLKDMQPLLKAVPQLKLYSESGELFVRDELKPLNVELVTLQCVISRVLTEIFGIKAANATLKDVLHYNKKKTPLDLQNFFILLEVYGYQYPINFFEPSITPLSMQRRKAQKDLQLLRMRLKEQLTKLELSINDCSKSFG